VTKTHVSLDLIAVVQRIILQSQALLLRCVPYS
jgi:hypothetical protein